MKKLLTPLLFLFALFSPMLNAAPVTIKIAYESNPGEPADTVVKHWAELVKKKSNGDIVFELYPSSQLGSKQDITEQALMGMNIITISDVGFLTDGNDSNLLIVFYVQIMPDDLVMQLHR
ncbi:hypothetical protein QP337_17765, partial [Escherichia coli]|nr:hypothetical protein [Escherichia coli]